MTRMGSAAASEARLSAAASADRGRDLNSMACIDPLQRRTMFYELTVDYLRNGGLAADAGGSGEIAKVAQVLQPLGRFSVSRSL